MYTDACSVRQLDHGYSGGVGVVERPRLPNNVIPLTRATTRASGSAADVAGDSARNGAHLRLLGAFRLMSGGRPVPVGLSVQRLVALLALREQPVARSTVAGQLWPTTTDARAHANLRTALYRLGRSGVGIVEIIGRELRLAPNVHVDAMQV